MCWGWFSHLHSVNDAFLVHISISQLNLVLVSHMFNIWCQIISPFSRFTIFTIYVNNMYFVYTSCDIIILCAAYLRCVTFLCFPSKSSPAWRCPLLWKCSSVCCWLHTVAEVSAAVCRLFCPPGVWSLKNPFQACRWLMCWFLFQCFEEKPVFHVYSCLCRCNFYLCALILCILCHWYSTLFYVFYSNTLFQQFLMIFIYFVPLIFH